MALITSHYTESRYTEWSLYRIVTWLKHYYTESYYNELGKLGKKFRCNGKICTHYTKFGTMTIRHNGIFCYNEDSV